MTDVDWHENHRVLKVCFPVDVRSTRASYDIQYGYVERPTHYNTSRDYARFEVVAHKWADLSESNYGVSLLNDCKYGYSVHDNLMRLTLLKSGKYPAVDCNIGHHQFTYSLLPHCGNVAAGNTIEEAAYLNQPLRVLNGEQIAPMRLLQWNSPNVQVDAVKKAEDDNSVILRFHEIRGGHDVVDWVINAPVKELIVCDLLEKNTNVKFSGNHFRIHVKPFELCTVKILLN